MVKDWSSAVLWLKAGVLQSCTVEFCSSLEFCSSVVKGWSSAVLWLKAGVLQSAKDWSSAVLWLKTVQFCG